MFPTQSYSKRYHHILLPHSQYRFNSLKTSHALFQSQHHNVTKRHSLGSRHSLNGQKNASFVDNVQDFNLATKNWGSRHYVSKGPKSPAEGNVKLKYFWKGKHGKSSKRDEKSKMKKVKRNWSELGKHESKKSRQKCASISKYENLQKINTSDRLQTKHEVTNGKSSDSYKTKKGLYSGERMKKAKSLLNSTMLTKRQSEQPTRKCSDSRYTEVIVKLKDILSRYEKKMKQLKEEKDFYKQRLRKEKRRS